MGLFVSGEDTQMQAYPWGSVPELADRILDMRVIGFGPTTLPELQDVQTSTITAKLRLDDEPLADAKFEICRERHIYANRSFCSDDPPRIAGRTNRKGVIRVEGLLGSYKLFVRAQGEWHNTPIRATCMRADTTCDLGTLEIEHMH